MLHKKKALRPAGKHFISQRRIAAVQTSKTLLVRGILENFASRVLYVR